MSSQLGHVGMAGRNIYNMTKFGIEGLTKGMGVELAKNNIRVNTVAPTFVETPMVKNFFKNKNLKRLLYLIFPWVELLPRAMWQPQYVF
jgi:Dehydrogenases with different specificities (related to short-chain alcohol dehydrogenases)